MLDGGMRLTGELLDTVVELFARLAPPPRQLLSTDTPPEARAAEGLEDPEPPSSCGQASDS